MESEDINVIRDIALDLEHSAPSLAIRLLEIAHKYRPNGGFIIDKLASLSQEASKKEALAVHDFKKSAVNRHKNNTLTGEGAVLEIRSAGIGDMLNQCSAFFAICDHMKVEPFFSLPRGSRNEISLVTLFQLLGFIDAGLITSSSTSDVSMPLSKAVNLLVSSQELNCRRFRFDMDCYGSASLKEILKRSFEPHISMTTVIKRSNLYKSVMAKKKSGVIGVALHVRLGDVAQIDMDFISHILRDPHPKGKILHARGIFDSNTIKSQLPSSNTKRFKSINAYAAALDNVLQTHSTCHVSLLSDGMTRVARHILKEHRDMMKNPKISHWQLENELNAWLKPLVERSDKCLIGEGGGLLVDTLIEGLSSDIIISGSPGLFKPLSSIMGLNNMFVNV